MPQFNASRRVFLKTLGLSAGCALAARRCTVRELSGSLDREGHSFPMRTQGVRFFVAHADAAPLNCRPLGSAVFSATLLATVAIGRSVRLVVRNVTSG